LNHQIDNLLTYQEPITDLFRRFNPLYEVNSEGLTQDSKVPCPLTINFWFYQLAYLIMVNNSRRIGLVC